MKYNIFHKIIITHKIKDKPDQLINLVTFNSLMINNDVDALTDTCIITIPFKNLSLTSDSLTVKPVDGNDIAINKGDTINIYLDYYRNEAEKKALDADTSQRQIFVGYIKGFNVNKEVIEILCEDSMYLFKQKKTNFSYGNDTSSIALFLAMLVEYGLSDIDGNKGGESGDFPFHNQVITDTNLGKIRTQGYVTFARVCQQLKDKYKFYTYFKLTRNPISNAYEPKLFFGVKYALEQDESTKINKDPIKFEYPYKYVDDQASSNYAIIQNGLDYQYFDKTNQLVVVGASVDSNKNNTVEMFTIDGINIFTKATKEQEKNKLFTETTLSSSNFNARIKERNFRIDFNTPNVTTTNVVTPDGKSVETKDTKNLIEESIKDLWNNHPESGFKNSFMTFGIPHVFQGDKIELNIDDGFGNIIIENYYVNKTITKITPNAGYQQEIFIGAKIKV